MNWAEERWIKLYVRHEADWLELSSEARGLFYSILCLLTPDGTMVIGKRGLVASVSAQVHGVPERVKLQLDELLEDGCLLVDGNTLSVPNFPLAQEREATRAARSSGNETAVERSKRYRQKKADKANKVNVTASRRDDRDGPETTDAISPSTRDHTLSHHHAASRRDDRDGDRDDSSRQPSRQSSMRREERVGEEKRGEEIRPRGGAHEGPDPVQARIGDPTGPGTPLPPDRTIDPWDATPPIPEAAPEPAQDQKPGSQPETRPQDHGPAPRTKPQGPRAKAPPRPPPAQQALAVTLPVGHADRPAEVPSVSQVAVSGPPAGTDPGGASEGQEEAAKEPKELAEVRYMAAYKQGVDRVLGPGGFIPPVAKNEIQALNRIAKHGTGGLEGSELLTWIATMAERYVRARVESPYERGFVPSKFAEWIAHDRAQAVAKRTDPGPGPANPDGDGMEVHDPRQRYAEIKAAAAAAGPPATLEEAKAIAAAAGFHVDWDAPNPNKPPKARSQVEAEMRAHQERMAAAAATVSTPEGVRAALAELTAAWTKGRPPPARTRAQASAELHAMIAAEAAEAKAAGETRH